MKLSRVILSIIFLLLFNCILLPQEIYKSEYRPRSGIAHGGIGTGSIELRKDGQFYNWSIFNNWPRGTGPIFKLKTLPRSNDESSMLFFLVRYKVEGEDAKIKLLQLNNEYNEAALTGIAYYFPWMTAVDKIEYTARFPFTDITFSDPEMPFEIKLKVHSPFIPHDVKNSSLPGVYFDFEIINISDKKVDVFLIGTLRNLVGYDRKEKYFKSALVENEGYKCFTMTAGGMDNEAPTFGEMGIASLNSTSTYYLGWEHKHPYYEMLVVNNKFPNIDDTEGRNKTDLDSGKKYGMYQFSSYDQRHFSSIGITRDLKEGESFSHSFLFVWYFPNAYGSYNGPSKEEYAEWNVNDDYYINQKITKKIGNYYNNYFQSASDVAEYMIEQEEYLRSGTGSFFSDFYSSDLDPWLLEQISSNLNTYRTSSTFNESGQFGLREGMSADKSWGPNITSDVTYYGSSSIITLFPELQLSSMKVHKGVQQTDGDIAHGIAYDLDYTQNGTWGVTHRVDLVGNYIQMVVRDYLWTNNDEYIRDMWPSLKKAFEFGIERWDTNDDHMPDMHGIMSSYDNFPMHGLASYIHSQWINTAKGMYEVSTQLNDPDSLMYKSIYDKSVSLMEEHLFNGDYYVLANDYTGEKGLDDGVLTDQLIGQWMAHQSGFGHLLNEDHIKKALNSIMDYSFKPGFGLRNCTWPEYPELFPIHESDLWVDQANTCWSGVELAFSSFLMYEDMYEEALLVAKTVDERYRKNGLYFDHQEFGGHYLRPMSAWGILNGILGFTLKNNNYQFSPCLPKDVFKVLFASNMGTAFFSKQLNEYKIEVRSGQIKMNSLKIEMPKSFNNLNISVNDEIIKDYYVDNQKIIFNEPLILKKGELLNLVYQEY